eukprot:TRINITY_DN9278_c0_g1_i1.p1 TRINITY_DN9278_c0_g1~~TRINITY_DN9278_c0_g1_i1.p1  ORF type:complete len:540 (-),score=130.78 TRINITY_DN9278_c0_g1_i1:43-1662(-)
MDSLTESMKKMEISEQKLSSLSEAASISIQLYAEIQSLTDQVLTEEEKLQKQSTDPRTVEEVAEKIEKLQLQSNELGSLLTSAFSALQTRTQKINKLSEEISKLEKEIISLRTMDDDLFNLKKEIDKHLENKADAEKNIAKYKEQGRVEHDKIQRIQKEREAYAKEAAKDEAEYNEERERFMKNYVRLIALYGSLGELKESNKVKLSNKSSIQEKKNRMEENSHEIEENFEKISKDSEILNSTLGNAENFRRTLEDNIRLKVIAQKISEIEDTLLELQEKVKGAADEESVNNMKQLQTAIAKNRTNRDKCQGSLITHQETLKKRKLELNSAQFKDIDKQHAQQLVLLETSEIAHKDLEKYYVALDKALMKYHTIKMAEINKIIKELWESTYRGNDIEGIEIRAEVAESGSRKLYDYRVIMIKDGVPVDMRGRCSAGQKVLTSLIIRLALAESFCINCGILTLDEPTTNLDRRNVESFANALVNIIENRKAQQHFQLIIITHDEDFVQLLGRSEHADFYYRVTKDAKGQSSIEQHKILEL